MAAGFFLARRLGTDGPSSAVWFSAACILVGAGVFSRGWLCRVALSTAVVAGAGGWFALCIVESPRHALAALLDPDPLAEPSALTIEGLAVEGARTHETDRTEFDAPVGDSARAMEIDADTVIVDAGRLAANGRVRLLVSGPAPPDARAGDRVRATGTIEPVQTRGNPGEFDLAAWAAQEGVAGSMGVTDTALVQVIPGRGGAESVRSAWFRWRGWLRDRSDAALGGGQQDGRSADQQAGDEVRSVSLRKTFLPSETEERPRALLRSMLLGERDPELREVQSAFANLGLVHLVAISGFNLAVMAFIALFLLRTTGDRGWLEPALLALVVLLYMLVLPAQAPIIRAGVLVLALLITEAGGRRYDRLSTLGWIGCALLLWRPLDLWSLGFQLSMGVTALLLWQGRHVADRLFGAPIRGLLPDRSRTWDARLRRALRWLWSITRQTAAVSLMAWAVAAPIVICHTGMLSPLAPLTTLLVLPLVTLVLWAGYIALLAGMLVPAVAPFTSRVLDALGAFLIDVVFVLDALPGMTLYLPRVSAAWAVAATVCGLWWFARGRRSDRIAWGATAIIVAWLGIEIWAGTRLPGAVALRVDTFAVGDGTCHLVRAGREAMLWDCGSLSPRIGERVVQRAVRGLGAWRVRTAVVTHSDLDHFSGLVDVVGPLGVRVVLVSRVFAAEAEAAPWGGPGRLLAALRERGVEVRAVGAGDVFELGGGDGARVEFLWPPANYSPRLVNDASLVARLSVTTDAGERAALMTGDIGREAIAVLMESAADRPSGNAANENENAPALWDGVSVLELPHHGSVNEAAMEFVREVSPAVVLQSTGPRRARRREWEAVRGESAWWVTARDGAASAEVLRDGGVRSGSVKRDAP